jgi:hypothetical protein
MNAVIIYDEEDYAIKAKAKFENAAHRASEVLQWAVKPWPLETLNSPSTAGKALAEAADAHLILFGLRNPRLLPGWLQNWLEQWAAHRQVSEAALAALGGANADLLSATEVPELSQFGERYGLSLICRNMDSMEEGSAAARSAIPNVLPPTPAIYFYRCGINE